MATSGDEKESDKQARKPDSKDVRKTKVERKDSLAETRHRARAAKGDGVTFRDMLRKHRKSDETNNLVRITKKYKDPQEEGLVLKNIYEKGALYDSIGALNDRVTSLASFISESYSLDWKESEKLARVVSVTIDKAVSEHRAGKPLSLEPTFTPAAEGADAQTKPLTLPDAPPKYPYAPRMDGGIVKYLEDNWAPYIAAGVLNQADLRRIDLSGYQALHNWMRQNDLPAHLRIPTKSEAIDREIEALGGEDRILHLAGAIQSRARRREPN